MNLFNDCPFMGVQEFESSRIATTLIREMFNKLYKGQATHQQVAIAMTETFRIGLAIENEKAQ